MCCVQLLRNDLPTRWQLWCSSGARGIATYCTRETKEKLQNTIYYTSTARTKSIICTSHNTKLWTRRKTLHVLAYSYPLHDLPARWRRRCSSSSRWRRRCLGTRSIATYCTRDTLEKLRNTISTSIKVVTSASEVFCTMVLWLVPFRDGQTSTQRRWRLHSVHTIAEGRRVLDAVCVLQVVHYSVHILISQLRLFSGHGSRTNTQTRCEFASCGATNTSKRNFLQYFGVCEEVLILCLFVFFFFNRT